MSEIAFIIEGKPEVAGSKAPYSQPRAGAVAKITQPGTYIVDKKARIFPARLGVKDDNETALKAYRQHAQLCANLAMAGRLPFDGPLEASFRFYKRRRKDHYLKDGSLSASGLRAPRPIVRPDALKMTRAIEDALSGVVYLDDSQIVDEHIAKFYTDRYEDPERIEIVIRQLEIVPAEVEAGQETLLA